jgi:hypothetical protein
MSSCVIKGKAFWELDNSGRKHLYFIISEPDIDDKVLIVFYQKAKELNASKVLFELLSGAIEKTVDLSENLLTKVQYGAKPSQFLPSKFKKYFDFFKPISPQII